MNTGFQWVEPPEKLARNIEAYGQRVLVALHAVAVRWGQECQDKARKAATWTPRTGAAQSGLFFAVDGLGFQPFIGALGKDGAKALAAKTDTATIEGDDKHLVITLGHTVFYGKYLELCNGGKYAVVMSTIESNLPHLEKLLKETFR